MCNITAEFMYAFAKVYIAMKMNDKKNVRKVFYKEVYDAINLIVCVVIPMSFIALSLTQDWKLPLSVSMIASAVKRIAESRMLMARIKLYYTRAKRCLGSHTEWRFEYKFQHGIPLWLPCFFIF